MQNLLLWLLVCITPITKLTNVAGRSTFEKAPSRKNVSLKPYNSSIKPSFFYLRNVKEEDIRKHLSIKDNIRKKRAKKGKLSKKEQAFSRVNVSYAEILASLKTLEEWKKTQQSIRKGEVKNIQMAKLRMEDNIRRMRLELVKKAGTHEEYQAELEAYRKFMKFKKKFLMNKGAIK